ncbi:MAG: hypothetical protein AB8H80_09025 [Planctomycetota bacterium]
MVDPAMEHVQHRVNNLLGTIEIQAEVARTLGTVAAYEVAMEHIVRSARRTRETLLAANKNGKQQDSGS